MIIMAHILPIQVDSGDGPAVVLLHGLGNNYTSWTFVLRRLHDANTRIIALDLLGFGDAPKPKGCDYTPKDHAKAVIRTLDSLQVTHAVIAGHSMGCIVAIEVTKLRPDLAKHLVLFGAPIYAAAPRRTLWSRLKFLENTYFAIFSFLQKNPDFTMTSASGVEKTLPTVKGMEITEQTWPAFKASLSNTIMQFQTYKDALQLQTPTLLVCGLLDFFIIRKNLKTIVRRNHRFVTFKTVIGPHEITPLQGRKIATLLQRLALRKNPAA